MTELLQFAPLIQSGVLLFLAFFVVFVIRTTGHMQKEGIASVREMHREGIESMKHSSEAMNAVATSMKESNIRIERLSNDIHNLAIDVKSIKIKSGEGYDNRD